MMYEINSEVLNIIHAKLNKMDVILKNHFTTDQLEKIVDNLITGHINRYLADEIHKLLFKKTFEFVQERINVLIKEEIDHNSAKHRFREYLYSGDFDESFTQAIIKKFENYIDEYISDQNLDIVFDKIIKVLQDNKTW